MLFFKYHHLGNDFIFLDHRKEGFPYKNKEYIQKICNRNTGIGADGVILLEHSKVADFRMRIFNSDGSEAASCGNGLLCFSRFVADLFQKKEISIQTMYQIVHACLDDEKASLFFPYPKLLQEDVSLKVDNRNISLTYIDSGVLHAVFFVPSFSFLDVETLGRKIRYHEYFAPHGVNVNFARIKEKEIQVKTYEKGVEKETLCCGTGAIAVARASKKKGPILLSFSLGSLEVRFLKKKVQLTGTPEFIYSGTISVSCCSKDLVS